MSQQEFENIIVEYLKKYNPSRVGIFGSFSRGEQKEDSDIDILVKFQQTLSLLQLVKIENDLCEKLGIKVDLVTEGALSNKYVRESIFNDLQIIYEV